MAVSEPPEGPARSGLTGDGGGSDPTSAAGPRSDSGRYVIAVVAGLVVALGALTAGLVLATRGAPSSTGTVVGSGAHAVPQPVITAPPAASVAPETPPATMGDHVAGDPGGAFYVRAADQQGDCRSVLVEEATFAQQSGWIVIHSSVAGGPGPILGVSTLQTAGRHSNVIVNLKAPLTASTYLFVMLHTEDNNDGTFDYPTSDQPAQLNGQIVMVQIYLKVGQ